MKIDMKVNGEVHSVDVPPMKRLLDTLRDDLRLTGTKEGCGEGECGACTVLIDGQVVNSCLVPAIQGQGVDIVTVEGLAAGETLHPVQQTFIEYVGTQCGICTPGMVLAAKALLDENPDPTRDEIREAIAGNLCRCTGYQKIIDSVQAAAAIMRESADA
jgi:aerobic carbon-monoxide dehydrogenase small subunit